MIERERILELADRLLADSPADDTEVFFSESEHNLTRFANNTIHQNVSITNAEVLIRVAFGKKVGVAGSNSLENAGRALEQACAIANVSQDSPMYAGLPEPLPVETVDAFDEAAAACTAMERAGRVAEIVEEAKRAEAVAAGALSTGQGQIAVVNSNGVRVHRRSTRGNLSIVMMKSGGSGTASRTAWRLSDIDHAAVAKQVSARAVESDAPRDIEPGQYTVVMEPAAVGVLLKFLAYVGFSGKAYHEKSSFMSGRLGLRVTGEAVTIADDPLNPDGMPMPFDFEGVPKRKITLIKQGVAAGMCFDTTVAAAEKTESTGHALPANSGFGPFPLNLFMAGGESSMDGMIASTKKGLLVCNFHYANIAERMKAVVTGMTRFGLFAIEDGRVAYPVKNLRFTQSVLEAFENISALTRERLVMGGIGGVMVAPGIKCEGFTFTGKTEF